jgi:hypothetical protein
MVTKLRKPPSADADADWITVAQWATIIGTSRSMANRHVLRLGIEVVDGRLHAPTATAMYRELTAPRAGRPPGETTTTTATTTTAATTATDATEPAPTVGYQEARRRSAVAQALMAEREEALQAGQLVRVADVRAALARELAAARQLLLDASARLVPLLLATRDPNEVARLLDDEMRRALDLMAGAAIHDAAAPQRRV